MRLPSHLCPATRINTGSSLYQTILVFLLRLLRNLCAFCVRPRIPSAPFAFAPVFPLRPLRSLPHSFLPKQSNAQRSQLRTASLSARAARVRLVGRFRRVGCSALAILAASLA